MTVNDYTIRRLTRLELNTVFAWAVTEGWNPGTYDGDSYYAADPNGFFGGFIGDELIGSVSGVAYNQQYGFIGLYIVRPEFRGQGYGLALFNAALDYLGTRTIGLDGVVAQQANYAKSGFQSVYRNIRFSRIIHDKPAFAEGIISVNELPFATLLNYDRSLYPAPRPEFLKHWLMQPGTIGLAKCESGKLVGYGVIRRAHEGYRIGPLFADNSDIAAQLLSALCASIDVGSAVFWDVPEINTTAVALAQNQGMAIVFEAARMYKGPAPLLPMEKIFGTTTLELG
jgi:GNAT superfamily N-acetyltransferase